MQQLQDNMRECWLRVALQGPEHVSEVASDVERQCRELAEAYHWLEVFLTADEGVPVKDFNRVTHSVATLGGSLTDAIEKFIKSARGALDDDGAS